MINAETLSRRGAEKLQKKLCVSLRLRALSEPLGERALKKTTIRLM
jgi:hypothetical protein